MIGINELKIASFSALIK